MAKAPSISDLRTRLDGIRREIDKLQAQASLLEDMLRDEPISTPKSQRAGKGSVKAAVLDLLEKAGRKGLNATTAVEMGKAEGMDLERGSVSSLLSRLKKDDVIQYDGEMYRLPKFNKPPTVPDFETSGGSLN